MRVNVFEAGEKMIGSRPTCQNSIDFRIPKWAPARFPDFPKAISSMCQFPKLKTRFWKVRNMSISASVEGLFCKTRKREWPKFQNWHVFHYSLVSHLSANVVHGNNHKNAKSFCFSIMKCCHFFDLANADARLKVKRLKSLGKNHETSVERRHPVSAFFVIRRTLPKNNQFL